MGRATIFNPEDNSWLIPQITETTSFLQLHTWEEVSLALSKFPWLNVIHDKPCRLFWERSKLHRQITMEL